MGSEMDESRVRAPEARARGAAARPGTAAAVALAAILAASCGSPPPVTEEEMKPLPPSEVPLALARGERLYRKACLDCHGARGNGNGPRSRRLEPHPWDFTRG